MQYWVHQLSLVGDHPIAGMRESAGNAIPELTLPIFIAMVDSISYLKIAAGLLFHRIKQRPLMFLAFKFRGLDGLPKTLALADLMAKSRDAMHAHLDELESTFAASTGPWILGAQFTLAEVVMMVNLERLAEVDWQDVFLTEHRANVSAYWTALKARPSYTKAIIGAFEHPAVAAGLARIVTEKNPSCFS